MSSPHRRRPRFEKRQRVPYPSPLGDPARNVEVGIVIDDDERSPGYDHVKAIVWPDGWRQNLGEN